MVDTRNKLDGVVKERNNCYYAHMSGLDQFGSQPTEDVDGRFYFEITVDGENVKFYQFSGYPNIFSDESQTESYIFTPDDRSLELHIINDYEYSI